MGTTAQKLQAILDSKSDIKDAIEAKGVSVGDSPFDEYASKINAIPTSIEEAPENDVNFYDYDGFRVASYTIAEAKALTALPTPPNHTGLTFQEWNWSLSDIQTYDRQYADVGTNYITSDGKTHLFACVSDTDVVMSFQGKGGTMTINWGDDNTDSHTFSSAFSVYCFAHTYTQSNQNVDISVDFTQSSNDGGYRIVSKNIATTTGWIGLLVNEIRIGNYMILDNEHGLSYNFICATKVSIPTSTFITKIDILSSYFKAIVVPKNTGINCVRFQTSVAEHMIYPRSIGKLGPGGYGYYNSFLTKLVVPSYTDTSALNNNTFITLQCSIVSIPMCTTFASAGAQLNLAIVQYIDIPQGWIPNVSMTLNTSTRWSAADMVRFFTNLGTTTNAITLTFGSTNLGKLTAEEKAIATNKGYTLA